MPDFVGEGHKGSGRAGTAGIRSKGAGTAGTIGSRLQLKVPQRTSSLRRTSSPIEVFRKLLSDFRGGIEALKRIDRQLPDLKSGSTSLSTHYHSVTNQLGRSPKTSPSVTNQIGQSPKTSSSGSITAMPHNQPRATKSPELQARGEKQPVHAPSTVRETSRGSASKELVRTIESAHRDFVRLEKTSASPRQPDPIPKPWRLLGFKPPSLGASSPSVKTGAQPSRDGKVGFTPSLSASPNAAVPDREERALPPGPKSPMAAGVSSPVREVGFAPRRGVKHSKSALVTGADREAAGVVRDFKSGSFVHFPAAARVAQVLRASSLISSGEAKPHPQLQALAQSAREGRMREVADVPPAVLQAMLEESLGGSENVQRALYTPAIHDIVEKQRLALGMSRESSRQRTPSARTGKAAVRRLAEVKSTSISHTAVPSYVPSGSSSFSSMHERRVHVDRTTGFRKTEDELRAPAIQAMGLHNDFAHLPSAMAEARAQEDEEEREISKPSVQATDRRTATPVRARREAKLGMPEAPTKMPSAPEMPSSGSAQASSSMKVSSAKPSSQRITGQLTLNTKDGQGLGTADFEGTLG